MSAAQTKAVAALIRIMPLMRREFAQSVDSRIFFSDSVYANSVLEKAEHAKDDRIVQYAREIRFCLDEMANGSVATVRASMVRTPGDSLPPLDLALPDSSIMEPGDSELPANPLRDRYRKTLR